MESALCERRISCPYCGELMHIVLDLSAGDQSYIEDCQICCQAMQIDFTTDTHELHDLRVNRAD
jgi:transcription elongation factor Elf1